MASNGGDNTEEENARNVDHVAADDGESHLSQGDHSQDDSVEYVGTIRKIHREILPLLPDQMLLSMLRAKIRPSFFY